MADVFTTRKRSDIMARVRSKGNLNTELALIRAMRTAGIAGWRRNAPIFGKPDFVFTKERVAVFVDGCFWHSCPIHGTRPKTNGEFWTKKLLANRRRDRNVTRILRAHGWRVLRIWQHELRPTNVRRSLNRLRRAIAKEPQPG